MSLSTYTAHSLRKLAATLPHVDSDRQAQLVRHAEAMLTTTDSNREPCSTLWLEECLDDIPACCAYYNEQADNLLAG
jgi:hypothetical protein